MPQQHDVAQASAKASFLPFLGNTAVM
jgi:hypothetical protein